MRPPAHITINFINFVRRVAAKMNDERLERRPLLFVRSRP